MKKLYSQRPFPEALATLANARQERPDPLGRVKLRDLFNRMEGDWSYEHLRRMVLGERTLKPDVIEAIAKVLEVEPDYFLEYRRREVDLALDRSHALVDFVFLMGTRAFEEQTATSPGQGEPLVRRSAAAESMESVVGPGLVTQMRSVWQAFQSALVEG